MYQYYCYLCSTIKSNNNNLKFTIMKTFASEREFVEMFATEVNNGTTNFNVNGIEFSVSGKSVNSSKAAVYAVHINGTDKAVTIIQLKKLLGVEYKKEYNRTSERAVSAGTKATIKTDGELSATAKTAAEKLSSLISQFATICDKYGLKTADILNTLQDNRIANVTAVTVEIFDRLKADRDKALAEKQAREEKAAKEKAAKVDSVAELTAELQKALADGNLVKVAEISAKISKAAK